MLSRKYHETWNFNKITKKIIMPKISKLINIFKSCIGKGSNAKECKIAPEKCFMIYALVLTIVLIVKQ
ncbi:Ankyrin repeat protein [Rickettsia rhipicephali str. 3-7-female6-CWPP]|uniref:Ankyrin repeat protein n=1 Tax=Rickettsia rhipicephali (strain 3-7-female6-CWPP) TaxID=1105113 RepID=A0AAI8A9I8_RICR3|nr:Ankyrin repeat protein [Rickettsia rhipicephali str. 3-7-female6-CWPP]